MTAPAPSPHWPPGLPRQLTLPRTNLFHNVEVAAARYPDKPFTLFYGTPLSFAEFRREAEALAGHLQQACGVQAGDRVLIVLQNSPQWALAFYAVLRANAVAVPVNPMNRTEELRHLVADSGAETAIVAQDLLPEVEPLLDAAHATTEGAALRHVVVAAYSDHLRAKTDLPVPDFVAAPRRRVDGPGLVAWADAVAAGHRPGPLTAGPDDLCAMPYTSGTTGQPKGCMHTHRSVAATAVGGVQWFGRTQDAVYLAALPFFHVTGLSGSLNGPLFLGATIVVLARWDRAVAAACIARHRVSVWSAISTMVVDFLALPGVEAHDLSSLAVIRGGGAAMPAAVARQLKELTGLDYVEGYGMSETMAATHLNPPQRPQPQCLGIPMFDVDSRIVDPLTLAELPTGETGEIVMAAPQNMQGYWRAPEATRAAFFERDGRRFLRSGDLGRIDADGYFFMTDRLKRMINASGFKVWPAEVEAMLYHHPAVLEACVIGAADPVRGETVKALVVRRPGAAGAVDAPALIHWARTQMAAYKVPRIVEFVDVLPKSGSGKILWRALQDAQSARDAGPARDNPDPVHPHDPLTGDTR